MGRGEPQRAQLRSPGGLATPQAGLVHRLGGPSGSCGPVSAWSMKPQSMQAMAPSSRVEPQEGHLVGVAGAAGAAGLAPLPLAGGGAGFAATAAGTAAAAGAAAGTMNACLHDGQRTALPAALSGTCIDLVQWGQRIMGMVLSSVFADVR